MIPLGMLSSRRAAVGGGGFSPADIAGLSLWLDGDSLSAMTLGDPISTWADSSSAGNDATQETTSYQPTYSTALGYPSAHFGAPPQRLDSPASASGSQRTIFAVAAVADASVRTIVSASANLALTLEYTSNRRPYARIWGVAGGGLISAGSTAGAIDVLMGQHDASTNYIAVQRNADAPISSTAATTAPASGRTIRIGAKVTTTEPFSGYIFEVLNYDAALDSAAINSVVSYLMTKYGLVEAL